MCGLAYELAKSVCDGPAIKAGNELARIGVDVVDGADIAVVDLLFVVVLDLHHLVAGSKRPTKPLDLAIAGGIERGLQFDVQRPCAGAARFIGHSTWMSRMGSRPNRFGILVLTSSMIRATAVSGSSTCTK